MGNELSIILEKQELASFSGEDLLAELFKESSSRIFLLDSFVSGAQNISKTVLSSLKPGDRLVMKHEKDIFDPLCVKLYTAAGEPAGSLPEKDEAVFARLLDAGKMLDAEISGIAEKAVMTRISVKLYLTDI